MKGFLATLKGKIIIGIASTAVITGGVVGIVAATSTDDYRTIKVEELTGQTVICDDKNNSQDAYEGMNLEDGDKVEVKTDANMTLLLDMDKYMFADAGTKFTLEATGNSEKSTTKTRIVLEEGSILCRIDNKLGADETYEVETPNSVMSVRGTILKASIFEDENGKKYTQLDVLEGSVKMEAYMENGEKAEDEGVIEAGQRATVHSDPSFSEFVIGDSNITYEDFSEPMAQFVVGTIEEGREIYIGESLFVHYTGLEDHPETYTTISEPTCADDGEEEIYCPTCDAVVGTRPIPATGEHEFGEWEVTTEATCDGKGVETHKCESCEETETRDLEATGHSYGTWQITTKATCESAGMESQVCSNCNRVATRDITATGHSYRDWEVTIEATCEEMGQEQQVCGNCGRVEVRDIEAIGHSYGDWEVTIEATCEEMGQEQQVCSNCDRIETRDVAATGHSYGEWTVTQQPGCETTGTQQQVCSNCNDTVTEEIAATGHSYGEWTVTQQPGCETTGIQEQVCSSCVRIETKEIAATGHTYGAWETIAEATCEEKGQQQRVCTVCNNEDTQDIDALGHLWPEGDGYKYVNHVINGAADTLPNVGDTIEVYGYVTCIRVGCTVSSDENHTMSGTVLEAGTDLGVNNGVADFSCSCGFVYSEYNRMVEAGEIPEGYTE